jgi:hypothetical protein
MKKIFWALFRCHLYLLCYGMWKKQMEFRACDKDDKLSVIFAGVGSLNSGTVRVSRIFYNRLGKTKDEIETSFNYWAPHIK